eukprot:14140041-Alexandrium_andersonii.AAC.1
MAQHCTTLLRLAGGGSDPHGPAGGGEVGSLRPHTYNLFLPPTSKGKCHMESVQRHCLASYYQDGEERASDTIK